MEEEKRESQKNVSDKFLDVIFDSLGNLDTSERHMEKGYADLEEFQPYVKFREPLEQLHYIEYANMKLMCSEFNFLFGYIEDIIDETKLKDMEEKLENIRKVIEEGIESKKTKEIIYPFYECFDPQSKSMKMILTDLFPLVCKDLSKLKREVIHSLSHILHSREKNTETEKKK